MIVPCVRGDDGVLRAVVGVGACVVEIVGRRAVVDHGRARKRADGAELFVPASVVVPELALSAAVPVMFAIAPPVDVIPPELVKHTFCSVPPLRVSVLMVCAKEPRLSVRSC